MGKYSNKTEAGSGGKIGHRNMDHWDKTEVIKDLARIGRRQNDRKAIEEQLRELPNEDGKGKE